MRVPFSAAVPVLAALSAVPAGAQVSARLHLDIPLGRGAPVIYGVPRRQVIVRDYDASRYGPWDSDYDDWAPVTLYYYDGYYYDYPIVEYAEPVVVYSYRDEYFLPPRDHRFYVWRRNYRADGGNYRGFPAYGRDVRGYRPMPREDDDDGRQFWTVPRDRRDGRAFQPGERDGRQYQRPPQRRDNGRDGRQGGDHGNGRSRPRP